MKALIDKLREGQHSLVVSDGQKQIYTYDGRGVSDLYRLLNEKPLLLKGAKVADKVVGKGAATLMVAACVEKVYAEVISYPALQLLENAGLLVRYTTLVPNIINRNGTGICPLEALCMNCQTTEDCLSEIKRFIEQQKK